jgi:anhydro-N-acetylmuramic acid kinase
MSGTSMDGADAVLAAFEDQRVAVLGHHHLPYAKPLTARLFKLQTPQYNEIEEAKLAALDLAQHYARVIAELIEKESFERSGIRAVALHGQTIRHRPELGYSVQINAPATVAELVNLDVICDFRSRDIAAGGQGAPLVPAFHAAVFSEKEEHRAVLNLGGMANLTDLAPGIASADRPVRGWDTGPGNVLLDHAYRLSHPDAHQGFDDRGHFAASGTSNQALLDRLLSEPWFGLPPPKSTGRERFDWHWLEEHLQCHPDLHAADLQATLAELTAQTVAASVAQEIPEARRLIVCGGGVANHDLLQRLAKALARRSGRDIPVESSEMYGVLPAHVEATAFAWLGERFLRREAGSRSSVTGARGPRVLGALYPA